MPIQEDQLNGRIATAIRQCLSGADWNVIEETGSTIAGNQRKPDILIQRPYPEPPIIIENEYSAARVEGDCLRKLGQILRPEYGGQAVSTVIGVHTPANLQEAPHGDAAESLIQAGAQFRYAAYMGAPDSYRRFPNRGFITGDIRNLVEFIRPAAEPAEVIHQAADTLAKGAEAAAQAIMLAAGNTVAGARIGEKLRQPWPIGATQNPDQQKADREARRQTANMAAVIIINALAYQQTLDGYKGIKGLAQVRNETASGRLTKDAVIAEFDNVLKINFWPIFHIAKELLLQIPARTAADMLEAMAQTADGILAAIRHNDVAGTVFQRLIADRKTLKTYYTTPEATTLLAHLAIPENRDWGNPETLTNYHIADYACGSGGIMLAAYQRVRELHRLHGGNPDLHHARMMKECLTACDIMPAGVHLTAALLSSVAPQTTYESTRCILFPFGGQRKTDENGQPVVDESGNPVKELNRWGKPIVHLGSISLLNLKGNHLQAVMPPDQQAALSAKGENKGIEVPMSPLSQDLVAMNPPFTKPTKHAPFATDHVEPKNPAFAAFGATDAEQKAMKRLESRLGENTISDGNAGLGTTFTAIADNMVKPGGRIALILPTSSMMGGSYDPEARKGKGQAYSWQRLRNLLYHKYDQIMVISIAQPASIDSAFSADSDFADCIVIARRLREGVRPNNRVHFVNLKSRPATKLEAQETARAIKSAIANAAAPGDCSEISIGDDEIGFVRCEAVQLNRKWTTIRIANHGLIERAKKLSYGQLSLPRRAESIQIPITKVGRIAQMGPIARDITEGTRGPFTKVAGYKETDEYPMLWSHAPVGKERQNHRQEAMLTKPDCHGVVKRNRVKNAAGLWAAYATHLHINAILRFNANSTIAAFTKEKALGGRVWPTVKLASTEYEKALCVWFNSTLGMISYWQESNRNQDGRGATSVTAAPDIPVLDVTKLSPEQLDAAVAIFNDLCEANMLPANQAWEDPVRQELDRRLLLEALQLDDAAVEQLDILRRQWCAEPTVTATKKTGPRE